MLIILEFNPASYILKLIHPLISLEKKSLKNIYCNSKNWLFKMSYFIFKNVWNWKMSEIEIKYISCHFEIWIFWERVSTLASSTNLLERKKRKKKEKSP